MEGWSEVEAEVWRAGLQWKAGTVERNDDRIKEKKVRKLNKPRVLEEFPAAPPSRLHY